MNALQPPWRPESARATPERCARAAARGGGSPAPSHPPLSSLSSSSWSQSPARAGPSAPIPQPATSSASPARHLGRPALPWVRVGAASRAEDQPSAAAAAGRGARTPPLAARGRRAWGARCEPAPWEDAGAAGTGARRRQRRRRGAEGPCLARTRGRERRGRGKSEAGRRRRRKVGIDASVFCCRCCPRAGSRAGGKAVER